MTARAEKPALLIRVLTEIGKGEIYEAYIKDKHEWIHGQIVGKEITINPAIEVVDTLIHEAIHRMEPKWSERYVRNRTSWLMRRMSEPQVQALYEEYKKIKKPRKAG